MFWNKKKEKKLDETFDDDEMTTEVVTDLMKKLSNYDRKIVEKFFKKVDEELKKRKKGD